MKMLCPILSNPAAFKPLKQNIILPKGTDSIALSIMNAEPVMKVSE